MQGEEQQLAKKRDTLMILMLRATIFGKRIVERHFWERDRMIENHLFEVVNIRLSKNKAQQMLRYEKTNHNLYANQAPNKEGYAPMNTSPEI